VGLDLNRIGDQLQNVSGIVGGVDATLNGAPGGIAAQDEQGDFSLAKLGNLLGSVGRILSPPKPETAPSLGDRQASPVTGEPESAFPTWLPLAVAGGFGLLIVVVLFARR
jgi:hypothetical protein